jgi:hypothetical protein
MRDANEVAFAHPVERELARLAERWSLAELAAAATQRDDRAAA